MNMCSLLKDNSDFAWELVEQNVDGNLSRCTHYRLGTSCCGKHTTILTPLGTAHYIQALSMNSVWFLHSWLGDGHVSIIEE